MGDETDQDYIENTFSDDDDDDASSSDYSVSGLFSLDMLTNDDIAEIIMDIYEQIDTYFQDNIIKLSSPTFYSDICTDITETLYQEWETADLCDEDDYDDITELVESVMETYNLCNGVPQRSQPYTLNTISSLNSDEKVVLSKQIAYLQSIPQPEQRSQEWYAFRNELITASNLWKVFGSQSQINSLIYEKCKSVEPDNTEHKGFTSTNSPMHWGVKYEPVSVMLYETMYQTKVGQFGCIQHPEYSFIGASPDGINIEPESNRYGRMIEIKNIVNREINGIPKEEYWIQTQIQMETCNLDKCDFIETRIMEYPTEAEFYSDTTSEYKGIILHFMPRTVGLTDAPPVYRYMPLNILTEKRDITAWIDATKQEAREQELVLFTTIYWHLAEFSCVLIERNREWFAAAVNQIKDVWNTILLERTNGYEHRAAKKRIPKIVVNSIDHSDTHTIQNMPANKKICLLKLDFS
jgi:putative phage-type endonuclease